MGPDLVWTKNERPDGRRYRAGSPYRPLLPKPERERGKTARRHPVDLWGDHCLSRPVQIQHCDVFFEFRKLSTCRFDLYKLNPFDTYALQQTSAGLKQLGMVSMTSLPFFLLVLLMVFPGGSDLNVPITAGFLFVAYLATAIGILFPLGFLGGLVRAEKWRLLGPLQAELNQLADGIPAMSKDEHEYFIRLQTYYQTLRDTKDSFLSVSSVARIGGALLLSTVTVILTAVVQEYLERFI